MKATSTLMEEHRVIEGVLDSLDAASARVASGQPVRLACFLDAADFIRGFADGFSRQQGPVAVMLAEHEEGRRLTRAMSEAAQQLQDGDEAARAQVVENARGYVNLLRQHIWKEDNVLFPMADRSIPLAEQPKVEAEFDRIEQEETGEGLHEKYETLARALAAELGHSGRPA